MDTTLSQAIKEAYAAAPANVVIHHTLELRHPAFSTPIRVVRDFASLTATLESTAPANPSTAVLFTGYSFDIELPELSDSAAPEIVITIDNVSLEIEDNINAALQTTDKVQATYRAYLSTDLSVPSNNPPLTLTLTSISADQFRLTARAQMGDYANRKFPFEEYTATRFPGLVR